MVVAGAVAIRVNSARLWRSYNTSLKTNPLSTKSLTCMTAYALGDVIAQIMSHPSPHFKNRVADLDAGRTARLAVFGLFWTGPTGHAFYSWLDKAIMPAAPRHGLAIGLKVALDQLLFSPLCTAAFFAWLNVARRTPNKIASDVSTLLLPTTATAIQLWGPASTISMSAVPADYRMLFLNAVSVLWIVLLSKISAAPAPCDELLDVAAAPSAVDERVEHLRELLQPRRRRSRQEDEDGVPRAKAPFDNFSAFLRDLPMTERQCDDRPVWDRAWHMGRGIFSFIMDLPVAEAADMDASEVAPPSEPCAIDDMQEMELGGEEGDLLGVYC